jgi:hypothetical protein
LIGSPSPVVWSRGQARPVRYLDTDALRRGTVETEETKDGGLRAVVGDFTLTVAPDGTATLVGPPPGRWQSSAELPSPGAALIERPGDLGALDPDNGGGLDQAGVDDAYS